MLTYGLILFLHVLLFAYWLGADLGVFLCGSFAARATSFEAKRAISEVGVLIDMAPRTCLVLMVPVGFTLAQNFGSPITGTLLVAVWIASLAWLWLVWQVHFEHGSPRGKLFWKVDFAIRTLVMIGFLALGGYSLGVGAPISSAWLATKILLFGVIILVGLIIRLLLLRTPMQPTPQTAGTSETPAQRSGFNLLRGVVLVIWALVAVVAYLGVAKPF